MALEQHACGVVLGPAQSGRRYDTCIQLDRSLSKWGQAQMVQTERRACSERWLESGTGLSHFSAGSEKRPLARVSAYEGPLRYCRPGVLGASPARRNASAIVSPLVDPAGWSRFSDPVAVISARVMAGRASRA